MIECRKRTQHLRALQPMAQLADAVGNREEAEAFRKREKAGEVAFQQKLYDPERNTILLNGKAVPATKDGLWWTLTQTVSGTAVIEER